MIGLCLRIHPAPLVQDALLEGGLWVVVEFFAAAREIGVGLVDVALLHRLSFDDGLRASDAFDGCEHVVESDGFGVTEVPDAVAVVVDSVVCGDDS